MRTDNFIINKKVENEIDFSKYKNETSILVQIFCGENKKVLKKIIKTILEKMPHAICIGSTTDGEIKDKKVTIHKTVVSISTFKNTILKTAFVENKDSFQNGYNLAKELITSNTKLIITFTDGNETNGELFLKGIETVNNKVIISGGMAGDNGSFTQTYISSGKTILKEGAVGVSLSSDTLNVCSSYNFSWSPIGIEHTIDEVKDNRVYKISGMTPVEFYEKYLGEYIVKTLPATGIEFPLIIQKNGLPIARAVVAKHKDGTLSFAGNLYKGDKVKLGFGNIESFLKNPFEIDFLDCEISKVESFFIYSCMARRRYIPDMINVEIEPFAKIAPTAGFFTYGEFYHNNDHNELLNQTLTVVALSEKPQCIQDEPIDKIKTSTDELSDYGRSLQALTHLIQQSNKDYDEKSRQLEETSKYSQNLLESQKQFLKYAVHEINTPLSIIMGNIEMFELENGKNKYVSNMEVALKNISSIYEDLSYLIKKDHVNDVKQNINLVDFVKSRIDFFSQTAIKFKSEFNFIYENANVNIYFNEMKLQRIVDNNLTNAIKYSLDNEIIYVYLNLEDDKCYFTIKSKSTQILDKEKIFEEYYREKTTKQGFGLGLNLVKKICEEEDIKIQLEAKKEYSAFRYIFKGVRI